MKEVSKPGHWQKHALKLFSFGVSVVLWFYVLSSEPIEIEKEYAFDFVLPSKFALEEVSDYKVKLKLKGPRAFLRNIIKKDSRIELDIGNFSRGREGELILKTSEFNYPLPFGVSFFELRPEELKLKIGQKKSKSVPISLKFINELKGNNQLVINQLEIKNIKIEGAQDVLKNIESAHTMPIDLATLTGEGQITTTVLPPHPLTKITEKAEVVWKYSIRPKEANLTLKRVPIRFVTSKKIIKTSHRYASIMIYAEDGVDTKIPASSVSLLADIPESKNGDIKVDLQVKLPPRMHLLKILPEDISVTIK